MIKRYDADFDGYIDRARDGKYVLYDDHVKEIESYKATLKETLSLLKEALVSLDSYIQEDIKNGFKND